MRPPLLSYEISAPGEGPAPWPAAGDDFADFLARCRRDGMRAAGVGFACFAAHNGGVPALRGYYYQSFMPRGCLAEAPPAVENPVLVQGGAGTWNRLHRLAEAALARYERSGEAADLFVIWEDTPAYDAGRVAAAFGEPVPAADYLAGISAPRSTGGGSLPRS